MNDLTRALSRASRRDFLKQTTRGLGAMALGSLLAPDLLGSNPAALPTVPGNGGVLSGYHHAPKAKRVIYLFQSGAPSHLETFDYKPLLNQRWGEEIPASVRGNQRLSGMLAAQSSFPLVGSIFDFKQHPKTALLHRDP